MMAEIFGSNAVIQARTPGKLVIMGEYAVLEGAPAIVMAVGVHARALIRGLDGAECLFIEHATGEKFPFCLEDSGNVRWTGAAPGRRGAVPEAVFAAIARRTGHSAGLPAMSVELDTGEFFIEQNSATVKLGLGSSAAIVTAMTGAVMTFLGLRNDDKTYGRISCAAHRDLQGGIGSGIDVLTSLTGGVIAVHAGDGDQIPDVEQLNWPEHLHVLPVWSGNGASTPELLTRFYDFAEQHPVRMKRHLQALRQLAVEGVQSWREGNSALILGIARNYDEALRALDTDAGIGIDTKTHNDLRELSATHGAVYKTSGAGGGDFGLALSDSIEVIEELKRSIARRGIMSLDATYTEAGLMIEPQV